MNKIASLFLLFSLLFLTSASYAETDKTPTLESVSLQLKWKANFQFAGYYAALEQGFYEQEGLDVTISPLTKEREVVEAVSSGELDYAIGGSGILLDYANGAEIKALAAIFQHDALVFIAKESSGIMSPYEMAGSRIMFDGTSGDDAPLTAMLADVGIKPSDFYYSAPTFSNQTLVDNKIDVMSAYLTDQPFALRQQNIKINIINPRNYGFDFYGDILYTSQAEIENHPGRAERFRRASLRGWQYALQHSEELIQLIKNKYGSESTIEGLRYEAKETQKLILADLIPIGTMESKRLRRVADTYAQLGLSSPLSEHELAQFILKTSAPVVLSEQEQAWLEANPVIRVGIDRDFAPYEWVNDDGEYVGLSADYLSLIEEKLGINFDIIQDKNWSELLSMAQQGELEMFSCVANSTERQKYLNFSLPYVSNPVVIVNATRNGYIGNVKKLAGKVVAVEKGYFTHDQLVESYPSIELLLVDTTAEALKKVSTGEADAYIGDAAYTNYSIKKASLLNLQFAGEAWGGDSSYRMGVIKAHPELAAIINKALNSIDHQERLDIEERWMGLTVTTGVQRGTVVKVSLIIASLGLILLIRHYQVSKSRKELQQVKGELQLYGRIFDEAREGIVITNANKKVVDINQAFIDITGYNREDSIGHITNIFDMEQHNPELYAEMWQAIDEHAYWQGEVWKKKKNGEMYAELLSLFVLTDESGKILHYVGVFLDITDSKQQQEELKMMAHYDMLTSLPNRTLFSDRFNQAIVYSKRNNCLLAVCFLDLDEFKPINDNHGHNVGDQLLVEVAERIKDNLREGDTVSRQGGDEFAILLSGLESFEQCDQILNRIHLSLALPYVFDGVEHKVSASSGVTIYPIDDSEPETLMRHADYAMYQAKQAGRNRYHFFNAEQDQQLILKNHQLEEIEHALIHHELHLYYQAKVNMKTGAVFGAEALIRWIHPDKGIIPPLEFLPAIAGTDLEINIGNWVIDQALMQLSKWKEKGIILEVSVNVSSHHLQSPEFVDQLELLLSAYPEIDSQYLQLEILESSALGDVQAVSSIIKKCRRELGVGIALDDFGTGYSSLTHLRNLPVGTIKIDQTFVRDVLDDPDDFAIIAGILGLANSFGREVIAEGVETAEHGKMLLLMGCDEAQGYGIAKPMPADELTDWIEVYQPNQQWLDFIKQDLSLQDKKLLIFKLAARQWIEKFEANINTPLENIEYWPIMDKNKCSCGVWVRQAQQEALFSAECLTDIHEAHELFHQQAYTLLLKHQDGDLEGAHAELTLVKDVFNNMVKVIELAQ